MSDYRLYFLDPASGRFERTLDLQAHDDAGAIALAQTHVGRHALELWTDARKVRRFPAETASAPAGEYPAAARMAGSRSSG